VPVMYRLLERIPASPKNSRTRQEPTAKVAAPQKGKPAGKPAAGAVDITTVLDCLGGQ
jgi:hypothetical protein